MTRRLRIGLLTASRPDDVRAFSGITWFIRRVLERHVGDVSFLGPATAPPFTALVGRIRNKLGAPLHRGYDWRHSRALARAYHKHFRKFALDDFDLLVAPAAATELAHLPPTSTPVLYVTDATFALLSGYYAEFSQMSNAREANEIERAALTRAAAVVYPSAWAGESAVRDYGVPRDNIHVVPFGANLVAPPTADVALRARSNDDIRLVLIGVDWVRKGCDVAVAAVSALRRRGMNARLTIVGCHARATLPPFIEVIPFLDKSDAEQDRRYRELLLQAHAMILPTRADCSPIAIAEANAHGLPAIVTDTGGVRGMLVDGVNGVLVPQGASADAWADAILSVIGDEHAYERLRRSARAAFDERLNWDAWARSVDAIARRMTFDHAARGRPPMS
jgi:glycosyltransferase involved in cell wall biosynthesis